MTCIKCGTRPPVNEFYALCEDCLHKDWERDYGWKPMLPAPRHQRPRKKPEAIELNKGVTL